MPTIDESIRPRDGVSPEQPVYFYRQETGMDTVFRTASFMVICDEGWRESVVCSGMYEWAAKWLVEELQGKPFAPLHRP